MIEVLSRFKKARKNLTNQINKFEAIQLREDDPIQFPVEFEVGPDWQQVSKRLGTGEMMMRTSYQGQDEIAVSCWWDEGAYLKKMVHPDAETFLYVIKGALRELESGSTIRAGEDLSAQDALDGLGTPFVIPAGVPQILQAVEPETFFIMKLKPIKFTSI